MKKKNKHLKEKSKRFKEYKKKKSYSNLKNDIKTLPREIQMMIFMMAISSANSDNFNYHKPKFYKTLQCLNVHFGDKTRIKTKDGVWYNRSNGFVKYSHYNICDKYVDTDQTKLLEIICTNQELYSAFHNFELPVSRNYQDTGIFWFHDKCRCKNCDKIKLYALNNDNIIYKKQKYEYDLYKKEGSKHSISGMKYYRIEHKDIYPVHKKMYKDLKFNFNGSWKSCPTFLEHLKYFSWEIFDIEHKFTSVFNITNRYL
jgi:hypothetical protein